MDYSVEKNALLRELQQLQGVVERKTTVPILSNLLLETSGNNLEITGTDLDVTLKNSCPAEIRVSGAATVSARKLFDIVRLLPESKVHFKTDEEGDRVQVLCERSRFKIATMPKENFPEFPATEGSAVDLPAAALRNMISRCVYAITQEESRYTLNGALMILNPTSLTFVTTDGHRLVLIGKSEEIKGAEGETRVLVPRKTLVELSKLSSEAKTVQFSRSDNHLFFEVAGAILVSRVLSGQFPNYEMVIPKDNEKSVGVETTELSNALKRVAVMSDEQSRAVRLSIKEGQIEVSAASADFGEARETLPAEYTGDPVEIAFNAQYVLDFLATLDTDDLQLALHDSETQGLFLPQSESDYDYRYVVMPMRV